MLVISRNRFVNLYLPPLTFAAVIFTLSCFHQLPVPSIDEFSLDKLFHTAAYTIFGYLIARALNQGKNISGKFLAACTILLGAGYGVSDEIHQLFVPGRFFSYWDMTADFTGAVLGLLLYNKLKR
ncbi:VanZ family protein [bacterium]|nr:VanZ family protein [FCB group bacterium]MBL7190831.1 VanZ family protein [bacterium]